MTQAARVGCGCCLCTVSLMFLGIASYTLNHIIKLTPVFRPITCNAAGREVDLSRNNETRSQTIATVQKQSCDNPNPYVVELDSGYTEGEESGIYIIGDDNKTLTPIGNVTMKLSSLPAEGQGLVSLESNMTLTWPHQLAMANGKTFFMLIRYTGVAKVNMQYLALKRPQSHGRLTNCGFRMAVSDLKPRQSPVSCAASLEEIEWADWTAKPQPSTLQLSPEAAKKANRMKNMGLGAMLIIQALLSVAFGACAFASLRSAHRLRVTSKKAADIEEAALPEGYGETREIRL